MIKIALLFSLICSSVFSQTTAYVDSLETELKSQKADTNRVKTLNELAWEYSSVNLSKAKQYALQSVELAGSLKFYKGRSSALNTLGNISSDQANNKEALNFYLRSLKDKEVIGDQKGAATVCNNIGIVYRLQSDSSNALKYYRLALEKRLALGDRKGLGDCYNNMGNLYRDYGEYDEAMRLFIKALEIRQSIDDKRGVAFTYNNIATVYDDRSEFLKALDYHYKAAAMLEQLSDNNSLARSYDNISILNKKLKNYSQAIKYDRMALLLAEKIGNVNYQTNILASMGDIYLDEHTYDLAKNMYLKGLSIAEKSGEKELQAHCFSGLGICSEALGNKQEALSYHKRAIALAMETKSLRDEVRYSNVLADYYLRIHADSAAPILNRVISLCKLKAYKDELKKAYKAYAQYFEKKNDPSHSVEYYKLASALSDSLYSEDVSRRFAQQQIQYETDKKTREIEILKQQEEIKSLKLEEQRLSLAKRNYLLIAFGLLILIIAIAGYFYLSTQRLRTIQMKERTVTETEEKERIRLAKDIHDDLGSGLTKIRFLAELISARAAASEEIKTSLRSISDTSVSLVDNMRDLIWALHPDNNSLESLVARIREYSTDYFVEMDLHFEFNIHENTIKNKIEKDAQKNLFFILKESLHNITKHAAATNVWISVHVADEVFLLQIRDNGSGPAIAPETKGNGLQNIRQRAQAIGGNAQIVSSGEKGTEVSISVPFKSIEKA
jgi:signal transduction histidine kinase